MNTVGNLFHQIEEISVAPRTVLMIYQLTAISWLSIGLTMDRHNVYFDIVADQCTEATRVHVESGNHRQVRPGLAGWLLGVSKNDVSSSLAPVI